MGDPRMWREVGIRGGVTGVFAAIAALFLDAGPWIWIVPAGVIALVVLRWTSGAADAYTGAEEGDSEVKDKDTPDA